MQEQLYGLIVNGEFEASPEQLEGYKPIVFQDIPEFDQATQYVEQDAPVDRGDDIYFGVNVLTMAVDEENNSII
jgi:hypothetical protein